MKHNILFVLPCSLYPLDSGGMHAMYNGIVAIQAFYNVFITYTTKQTEENLARKERFQQLMDNDEIKILPFFEPNTSTKRPLVRRIVNKFHHILNTIYPPERQQPNLYSYWIEELYPQPKAFILHVNNIINQYKIDIVQCEMLCTLSFIQCLPNSVKKVFVHHELGYVRHELELKERADERYDGRSYLGCAKDLEISQLNHYDSVVSLSPIDSQKLREAGVSTRLFDSFAIVKPANKQVRYAKAEYPRELTFVGPDIHGPNVLGLQWFLQNCWENLLKQNADYHLTIIGKWSKENIDSISSKYKNITFAGFVDDLAEALMGTIMIVPLTVGSGIRMKILEASNIGVPFITTSIGAEGIPLKNGTHCLIADSPEEFVSAIGQMSNEELRHKYMHNAQLLVKEHYSMMALQKNRLALYNSLLES